jgi:hypothetical protein
MRSKLVRVVFLVVSLPCLGAAQRTTQIVRPVEIQDVLVNPGMGITTFQRFNGQAVNEGLKWSEEGPAKVLPDRPGNADFPESSIAYCRWFWPMLEPERGKYNWSIIDHALEQARLHHQTLAIRLMPYDAGHPLPDWYRSSGARRANKPEDKDGKIWQPDFGDPLYLSYWGELVAATGTRYDGHPVLDTVDISSVGYWGEGWSPYMPAFEVQKQLINIYFEAFKKTPLLMNFDEERALAYATSHGAGWRLDCLGDMRTFSNDPYFQAEMLDVYPQQVARAGIVDVWKRSPVSLESCWVPGYWKEKGWDAKYILDQALRWHVTSVNIKSSAIPPDWKGLFDEFQKQMGYRFVLRRVEYAKVVRAGEMMPIHMWWLNAGVAPVYRECTLAVEIHSNQGGAVLDTPEDVRKWLPGDAVYDGTVYVPQDLKPGTYRLRIGLLDPRTGEPAIRLAIQGRQPDGWYDLGEITIE